MRPTKADFTLDRLFNVCHTFDPSDADQRTVVRMMVVPMLTQKLDWLRIALRANPDSASIKSIAVRIDEAIKSACIRLDCGLKSSICAEKANGGDGIDEVRVTPQRGKKSGRKKADATSVR